MHGNTMILERNLLGINKDTPYVSSILSCKYLFLTAYIKKVSRFTSFEPPRPFCYHGNGIVKGETCNICIHKNTPLEINLTSTTGNTVDKNHPNICVLAIMGKRKRRSICIISPCIMPVLSTCIWALKCKEPILSISYLALWNNSTGQKWWILKTKALPSLSFET